MQKKKRTNAQVHLLKKAACRTWGSPPSTQEKTFFKFIYFFPQKKKGERPLSPHPKTRKKEGACTDWSGKTKGLVGKTLVKEKEREAPQKHERNVSPDHEERAPDSAPRKKKRIFP